MQRAMVTMTLGLLFVVVCSRKRASKAVGASEGKKRKGTAYLFFCSEKRPGLPPGLTAAAQMKVSI